MKKITENTKITLTLSQLRRLVTESGMHHAERDLLTYAFNNGFKCSYEPLERTMTIRGKRGTFAQRGNGEDLLMVLCQGASVNPNDLDYEAGDSYMLKLKVDVKTHYWLEGYGEAPEGVYEDADEDRVIRKVLKDPEVRELADKLVNVWIEDLIRYPGQYGIPLEKYVSAGDNFRWEKLQHAVAAASNRNTKSVQSPKPPLRQPEEFRKPNKRK